MTSRAKFATEPALRRPRQAVRHALLTPEQRAIDYDVRLIITEELGHVREEIRLSDSNGEILTVKELYIFTQ